MYSAGAAEVLGFISLVWLAVLSYFFWKERSYLRQLFPKSDARDIRNKFRELIELINEFDKRGVQVDKQLREIQKDGLHHIQRVSVVRYNPYNDTGGDQSFTAALLDGGLNGLLITSLHSRSGTRIYIKSINKGKSDLELSKEEGRVLKEALEK